ncbi:hypothetical protein ABIF63_005558 [Bradyrhizobium japonicum]|uniref:Secreted protein n=1 Tax=Bradyrhizobium japonicum TaxID=375 RepID=A0ABV2RYT3_BRAJP|nr:hypothetical protein [Bradyrhizobium japonicum]MBR0729727.1 hypothetical protein [Bradyrhizobium japonicum]MCS3964111.1 hypothetical protein [Bradyrhizobium japonicum]UQD95422.1 hypothetical protein JEY30_27865 [Bradyrhizobium japonicum]WLB23257.1 hypothetical protein QIH95_21390 [Bradyrhizobium japonicum]
MPCFVTMCRVGVTVLSGAAGEIAKESRAKATPATRRHYGLGGGHRKSFDGDQVPPVARVLQRMISKLTSRSLIAASIF